jgi:hypothetical protein
MTDVVMMQASAGHALGTKDNAKHHQVTGLHIYFSIHAASCTATLSKSHSSGSVTKPELMLYRICSPSYCMPARL